MNGWQTHSLPAWSARIDKPMPQRNGQNAHLHRTNWRAHYTAVRKIHGFSRLGGLPGTRHGR
jgi:hypothetical protein